METRELTWEKKLEELIQDAKDIKIGYAREWLEKVKSYERVCIFGAGEHGYCWYNILKMYGISVDCFYDNDKNKHQSEIIDGRRCFSVEELLKQNKSTAVIIAMRDYEAAYKQAGKYLDESSGLFVATVNKISFMANCNFVNDAGKLDEIYEKLLEIFSLCNDEMSKEICCQTISKWFLDENANIVNNGEAYFFNEEIPLSDEECLVDAGAFDGDTIESFIRATNGQYKKIYAFEMDQRNYDSLKKAVQKFEGADSKIELYKLGLLDGKGVMHYSSNFECTQFEEDGNMTCEVDSLDNIFVGKDQNKKVTFIKMDIEGGEMKALHGARKLIAEQKPKLAICIYHSVDDFINIPIYIKQLNPEYKIIIRHHSECEAETVCYAI